MPDQEKLSDGASLIQDAVAWLTLRLPGSWSVSQARRTSQVGGAERRSLDAAIEVQAPNGVSTMVVEARRELAPRDVDQLFAGLAGSLRILAGHIPILVVAPWLSPRTRERLVAEDVNYLDLTGNALIRLENPALFLQATGSDRNPTPATASGSARVRGPKAARLVRLLADVKPPYELHELAAATSLTPGYVSRLLDTLDREALIERDPRGPVRSVNVGALLHRWAESYDVFASNATMTFLAADGADAALERLAGLTAGPPLAVTGSFAAVRHAPVAAPALLVAYSDDPAQTGRALGLLPASSGGNVALLQPFDPVVWERAEQADGIAYAAVSQVAVDCLTGNGRMPAEGEALIEWMTKDERRWRVDSLVEPPTERTSA